MWRKKGKGPAYKGSYAKDARGERVFVLFRVLNNGRVHAVSAESAAMAKAAGWVKAK